MTPPQERWLVFGSSLGIKLLLAFVFFGSVDVINAIDITVNAVEGDGGLIATLPYLPAIPAFHWFAGWLTVHTPFPIAFSYKLIPVIFDSFLAVLVYDVAAARGASRPFAVGMLYALSPVAIVITSLHGQWDAIFLFFLVWAMLVRVTGSPNERSAACFGVLMGVSILIKPVAIILAPFVLMPAKSGQAALRDSASYRLNALAAVSALAVLGIFILLFRFLINDWARALLHIFLYANAGYPVAGLPVAPPLQGIAFLQSRIWIVGLILILAGVHLAGRIDYSRAVLITFLLIPGLGGYSPQYLLWPMAILLALGYVRLGAVYTLAATAYLILFYLSPAASHKIGENVAVFAPLISWAALAPPADWFGAQYLPWLTKLGNYGLPALCLILIGVVWRSGERAYVPLNSVRWRIWPAGLLAASLCLFWIMHISGVSFELSPILQSAYQSYAMTVDGRYFTPASGSDVLNIVSIMAVGTVIWCVAAWRCGSNRQQ